ncbi:MAG: hypothetical protein R3A46_19305 [Thermomicrobiales bacterium]
MTSNPENTTYEQHGRLVEQTYASIVLTNEQRTRHRRQLREAARQPSRVRFSFISGEVAAIAAVTLIVVVTIVIWQSLDSSPSNPVRPEADATARTAAVPFLPPESCPVDAWVGPEDRLGGQYPNSLADPEAWRYSYFLDGSGITINARLGLVYEGNNDVFWLMRSYQPQDMTYSAERLDDPSFSATWSFGEPFTARSNVHGEALTVRRSTITFPVPGCWWIRVTSQDVGLRRVVYVYPNGAR